MKSKYPGYPIIRRLSKTWKRWVEPKQFRDVREYRLARTLNVSLLFLIAWGLVAEILFRLSKKPIGTEEILTLAMTASLMLSYFLNYSGYFYKAILVAVITLSGVIFIMAGAQRFTAAGGESVLYYLIVVILMSELFFSMKGFILATSLMLGGVFAIYLIHGNASTIFLFLLIFSALVGFSSYHRRLVEKELVAFADKSAHDQSMLLIERRATQIELLNQITNTMLQMPDLRQSLQTLADQIDQLMGADGTFITLWDEEMQQVIPTTAYGDYRD